jgi:hypothetical protein
VTRIFEKENHPIFSKKVAKTVAKLSQPQSLSQKNIASVNRAK